MPVYSKSGKQWSHDYVFKDIENLNNVKFDDNVIFYHHPYDDLMEGIPLHDALNGACWMHLKKNPTSILIHDNDSETFDIRFASDVVKTIKLHEINPAQLRIIVMDENHKAFLENVLSNNNISGVDIRVSNYLLNQVSLPTQNLKPIKKFSSLSRNYRDWRLRLYVELVKKDILDNEFIYSFFNIWPYDDPPKVYSVQTMIDDLSKIGFTEINKPVKKWLKGCPHELDKTNNVLNKWSNITYDTIMSSNIHIIIETHYDQKAFSQDKEYDRSFAPSSITEKAYKPIACKRPFIAFSTPHWLEDLRKLGFKTFAPYINESYDAVEDNNIRLNMIVDEIDRISKLPAKQFNDVVAGCQEVAEYNYNILVEKKNA